MLLDLEEKTRVLVEDIVERSDLAKARPIKKQPKAGIIINDRVIK